MKRKAIILDIWDGRSCDGTLLHQECKRIYECYNRAIGETGYFDEYEGYAKNRRENGFIAGRFYFDNEVISSTYGNAWWAYYKVKYIDG